MAVLWPAELSGRADHSSDGYTTIPANHMMSRIEITLPPELHRRAKKRADELGLSFSELTRRVLEREVGGGEAVQPRGDITAIFNLGSSTEPTDIAKHKDEYIGEAVEHEYLRKMGRLSKDEIGPPKAD
jgi:hypothetical protein